MFEINDIVKFRHWPDRHWEEGEWIILTRNEDRIYDDIFYSYTIQNTKTGQCHYEVNWQQIELL